MAEAFLSLDAGERADILRTVAARSGRSAIMLEKDIWVCWVLQAVFSMPDPHPMAFKGRAEDLCGAARERHAVLAIRLHALRRDGPHLGVQVDLLPPRKAHLARPGRGQHQELERRERAAPAPAGPARRLIRSRRPGVQACRPQHGRGVARVMLRAMSENALLLSVVGTGIGVTAVVVSVVAIAAHGINSRLSALGGELSARIDKTSARIDTMNDRIDARIDTMNDRIDARIDTMNDRIDALRREVREDHAALDARLREVQVEFAKVDQRLATVERVVLPPAPPA